QMNIYEKMNAVMLEIKTIPKNLDVGTGRGSYKAVAEADILAAVKQAEAKHGIFSFPVDRKVIESRAIHSEREFRDQNKDTITIDRKETQFIRLEVTYRFIDMESPKDFVDVKGYGDGIDSNDKAPGKAATYADKYALMKAYKIETGDDNDKTASDDLSGHDILKIKQRTEQSLTSIIMRGMDEADLLSALGINKKQLDNMVAQYDNLLRFENRVKKLAAE
ncbi:MAG: ERF family protein, partial [Oscillospiraceae bacterium]